MTGPLPASLASLVRAGLDMLPRTSERVRPQWFHPLPLGLDPQMRAACAHLRSG